MLQRVNEISPKDSYDADLNGANRPEPDGQSGGTNFEINDLLTSQLINPATLGANSVVHTLKDLVTQCYFTLILSTQAPMRCQYL